MNLGRLRRALLQWTEAPTLGVALKRIAGYVGLRLWTLIINCFPIETNLATARVLGKLWWLLFPRHRRRALRNLRRAFREYPRERIIDIGRKSLEHFAQLYLVELLMMPRLITKWSWARYVELDNLGPALRELLSDRGVIMLTGHFGNYELTGFIICHLGLPLSAIMRPLDNPLINRYLVATRKAGGLTLLYKKGATEFADDILDRGGTLCFIADQDAGRKGQFVEFFGRPASTYKAIGLLAMRHDVPVIIGAATRRGTGFRYRVQVERIIQPAEWQDEADPLHWVTQTFSHALEAAIRRAPEQYLWAHRRWKHQPPRPGDPRRRRGGRRERA
ncbi:MAG: lysophospholipid acyltransferase family protein [Phycisphaerae bacterium]|jgi:KDO2-lipid IV(A) lauroyltransferase